MNISLNISLATIYPIQVYINRTNNRLVFKIKDGCKLQLQTPEKNEIIWKHKKIKRQNKKCRKSTKPWSSWNSFNQCNLVDNQYQRKSKALCTFMPNKSCAVLLNIGTSNLLFDEIIVTFMDENGR